MAERPPPRRARRPGGAGSLRPNRPTQSARRPSGRRDGRKAFEDWFKSGGNLPEHPHDRNLGAKFLRGGEESVKGFPTGVFELGKAGFSLTRGNPRPAAGLLKALAEDTAHTVRHPTDDPFASLMLLLAAASAGGSAATRVSAASKAAKAGKSPLKAALKKPAYTRDVKLPSGGKYTVPASPNPLIRGARAMTLDQLFEFSKGRMDKPSKIAKAKLKTTARKAPAEKRLELLKKKGGGYAKKQIERRENQRTRFAKQARGEIKPGSTTLKQPKSFAGEALNAPMNALRLSMYARPRYAIQNLASTLGLLGMQSPIGTLKSVGTARKYRKMGKGKSGDLYEQTLARSLPQRLRDMAGESSMSSLGMESVGGLSDIVQKLARYANAPESRLRELGMINAARHEGIDVNDVRAMDEMLRNPESDLTQRVAERGNEAMVDYGRLGETERKFMKTGIPIFYPMFKGFARYGARFPSEHSILSALLAQLGSQGYEQQQEAFGGPLPPWSPYMVRTGDNTTINPQNIYPLSPAVDLARNFDPTAPVDSPVNLFSMTGPTPELLYALITGQSLGTGYRLPGLPEGASRLDAWKAVGKDELPYQSIPFYELFKPRTTKAYGKPDWLTRLGLLGLGPSFYPRPTDFDELRGQGER